MTDEVKKIREEIAKAKEQYKNAVMGNLMSLVKTSEKTSAMGDKYISVNLYDHRVLQLKDGELMFVNGDMTTYSIDNGDYELSDFEDIIRIESERREKELYDLVLERGEREQYELAQEIVNKTDINIVTCGDCGSVNLHRLNMGLDEEITCSSCGFTSEPCDFPDLFY